MNTVFEMLRIGIIAILDALNVIGELPEMARELRLQLASVYALARRLEKRPA